MSIAAEQFALLEFQPGWAVLKHPNPPSLMMRQSDGEFPGETSDNSTETTVSVVDDMSSAEDVLNGITSPKEGSSDIFTSYALPTLKLQDQDGGFSSIAGRGEEVAAAVLNGSQDIVESPAAEAIEPTFDSTRRTPEGKLKELLLAARRSKLGRLAASAAFIASGILLNAAPASADSPSQQDCIDAGLAMPQVLHMPTMYHAGIRPLDPRHSHSQLISGALWFPDMPEGCAPEWQRVSHGQVAMFEKGKWVKLGPPNNPGYIGDQAGRSQLSYGPNHAWPDYLFNMCTNGKFQRFRIVLINGVNDSQTHQSVAEKTYTLNGEVKGNCDAAQESERATEDIRATWGNG